MMVNVSVKESSITALKEHISKQPPSDLCEQCRLSQVIADAISEYIYHHTPREVTFFD